MLAPAAWPSQHAWRGIYILPTNSDFSPDSGEQAREKCSVGKNSPIIFQNFCVTEVYEVSRLLQTVLFLTDSVFYALCSYFDESMGSTGGYEPW